MAGFEYFACRIDAQTTLSQGSLRHKINTKLRPIARSPHVSKGSKFVMLPTLQYEETFATNYANEIPPRINADDADQIWGPNDSGQLKLEPRAYYQRAGHERIGPYYYYIINVNRQELNLSFPRGTHASCVERCRSAAFDILREL